jgi:hypothetical protein
MDPDRIRVDPDLFGQIRNLDEDMAVPTAIFKHHCSLHYLDAQSWQNPQGLETSYFTSLGALFYITVLYCICFFEMFVFSSRKCIAHLF